MRSRFIWSLPAAILSVALLALPVSAQESDAKTAWAELRARAREAGVLIASQAMTDYGTSVVAQNVRIFMPEEPDAAVLLIPELRIEPRGNAVALTPSPQFTLTVSPDPGDIREITFSHNGEVVLELTDDLIAVDAMFGQFSAALSRSEEDRVNRNERFSLGFNGFSLGARIEREGSVDVNLRADQTAYGLEFHDGQGMQVADAQIADLGLTLNGAEWDMLDDDAGALRAAFDAGFFARLALSTASNTGSSQQTFDGAQIAYQSTGGASDFVIDVSGGAIDLASTAQDVTFSGGMAPFVGTATLDSLGLSLGAPLLSTPDDQRIHYGMNVSGLTLSPELLQMLGAGDFAGEAVTMIIEASAMGRLIEDLGPSFGQGNEPPFDVNSVSLDRLETSIGATQLTGSGAFAFLGGLMGSIDSDIPNGTGDFVFDLIGGDALLTRLGAMGLIPEDQQFLVRMMMNGLGRPIGDDHLQSEVAIRPGGVVTVNGAPLPF